MRRKTERADARVTIDPKVSFGRPCVAGTGVPTREIASRALAGESLGSLCDDFSLSAQQAFNALVYELDRKRSARRRAR